MIKGRNFAGFVMLVAGVPGLRMLISNYSSGPHLPTNIAPWAWPVLNALILMYVCAAFINLVLMVIGKRRPAIGAISAVAFVIVFVTVLTDIFITQPPASHMPFTQWLAIGIVLVGWPTVCAEDSGVWSSGGSPRSDLKSVGASA